MRRSPTRGAAGSRSCGGRRSRRGRDGGCGRSRRSPGHLYEATGSGPRWLGAAADLAVALAGYRGRLVVWAGANTVTGPVAHYLGILAAHLERLDDAAELLTEAAAWEEEAGTLPFLAYTLAALADTLSRRGRDGDGVRSSGRRRRARDIAARLGMAGLLAALAPPADEWTLRRDGPDWLLEAGGERARLREGRGVTYGHARE